MLGFLGRLLILIRPLMHWNLTWEYFFFIHVPSAESHRPLQSSLSLHLIMVVTTKLLALLRKDAILVGRNKVWTTFEILIPVLILLLPLFFIKENYLLTYKKGEERRKSQKSLTGFDEEMHLDGVVQDIELRAYGCRMPPDVDVRIYDKYLKNHTRPDRIMFSQVVLKKVKECHPVGGVFVTSEGVDMIVPSTNDRINQLKDPSLFTHERLISSLYKSYSPYLYKAMSIKFRKDAETLGFNVSRSVDELKIVHISSINTKSFSTFSLLSVLIGLSITLPVINTARTVTVEKATIQPYLASIGLSRTIFYAEHFIFAVLKSSVLILIGILVQCIYLKRFQAFWMILGVFVYILGSISFTLFASIFFIKPRRVVEAVSCVWLISIWVPTNWNGTPSGWATFPALININEALHSYILAIEPHFVKDGGMTFFDGLTSAREEYYSCFVYLLIMAFDAIVLWITSVYLSIVVDKISKSIEKLFYSKARNVDDLEEQSLSSSEGVIDEVVLCEEVVIGRSDAPSDLELFNLKKIYPNGETAVNGLSMRTVRGQISVLLGHNGCGKSTTFGMIIGTVEQTSGTIIIEGLDASKNRDITRQSIGYCPQYNPLYEKLTVMEHLKLVNALKGICSDGFEKDAHHLLNQIELMDKADDEAGKLSGGMKRKLSMCMAMIGGSKVVLLDEPTAGMDPAARLSVQNMLNEVKPDRTILLTTHYMDEAEKLSDWVFVMSHGKMAASGSGAFLKKKFGDGYTLTLVLESEDHVENNFPVVERLCCALVEGAKMKHVRGRMIEITLPENQKTTFLKLFKTIEDIIEKKYDSDEISKMSAKLRKEVRSLKIVTIGLAISSLEQVFIKIENECDRVLYGIDEKEKRGMAEKSFNELEEAKKEPPLEGDRLLFLQARTIFYKRLVHLYRNPTQLILQFLIPCVILYLLLRGSGLDPPADASLLVNYYSLTEFPSSKVILRFEGPPDPRILNYLKQFEHLTVVQFPIQTEISAIVKNQTDSDEDLGLIISIWKQKTVVHFQQIDTACLPIALNLLANLKYIRLNSSIPVGNNELYIQFVPVNKAVLTDYLSFMIPIKFYLIGVLLSLLVIPAVLFLIEERTTKFQHQQMLTGISPFVFWAGSIFWDTMLFSIGATYTFCLIWIYGTLEEYLYLVYITFYAFFIATVAVVYLTSVLIKSPTIGSTFLLFLRIITFSVGAGLFFKSMTGDKKSLKEIRKLYAFGIVDPGYIQMYALTKVYMSQTLVNGAFAMARDYIFGFYSIFEFQAIWIDVLYLMLLAVLFFLLFVAITSQVFQRLLSGFKNAQPNETNCFVRHSEDDDSSTESTQKTNSGSASDTQQGKPVIVVDKLVKDFGILRAVNGLSIVVREKECFGLLGKNGSGKTTSFDMLTGLTIPSGGTASISGRNITQRIQIGYCPQVDALMGQLTGRESLKIVAKLQGYANSAEVVDMVLACVGMTDHADKKIHCCSGGQKRKISIGIALISRSHCVMLDEPTAGIDPRARRDIWDILHNMREQGNSAVVLTSHSMDECEALCTRIVVLREGNVIAEGTGQELKSNFGNFYLLTIVLRNLEQEKQVNEAVISRWPEAILKTKPTAANLIFVFQITKQKDSKWSDSMRHVEELAAQHEVEDFMLTQATLEDAFIRLSTS